MSITQETVHLLMLETDEPHPETQDRKGSFGRIFHDLLTEAGSQPDPPLKITTAMLYIVDDPDNDKRGHVPVESAISEDTTAMLITGSVYDVHGNDRSILQLLDKTTTYAVQWRLLWPSNHLTSTWRRGETDCRRTVGTCPYRDGPDAHWAEAVPDERQQAFSAPDTPGSSGGAP